MATNTGAFFVGVGTTFAILATGFGGGLMMARTAMEPRAQQQAGVPGQKAPPVRVILPASSEPAESPRSLTVSSAELAPPPGPIPIKEAASPEKMLDKVDIRRAE